MGQFFGKIYSIAVVAQWTEQARPKGKIVGSTPIDGTNYGFKKV